MLVVVTVESPRGRITLAAPNDAPVEQLIPELVDACRCERDGSRWSLRARGEEGLLAPGRTLDQCGLYQGAVLELRAEGPPPARQSRRTGASWAEVGLYHAGRAGARARDAARRALPQPAAPATTGARFGAPWQVPGAPSPPAAPDRQRPDTDRAIAGAVLQRGLLIAVLGCERGAGASTVAALLATLLAQLRSEPVTAVDTDAVSGSLSLCLTPGRRVPAADLHSVVAQGSGAGALSRQMVAERHGLLVLPAPILTPGGARLDEPFYTALLAQLTRSAELAVVDCGVAETPAGQAALASADLAVVCQAEETDGRRLELSLLAARSYCESVIVVSNRARRSRAARGAQLQAAGADRTVSVSHEPAAAARLRAAAFSWRAAPRSWQAEFRTLAAALLVDRSP